MALREGFNIYADDFTDILYEILNGFDDVKCNRLNNDDNFKELGKMLNEIIVTHHEEYEHYLEGRAEALKNEEQELAHDGYGYNGSAVR